MCEDECVSLSNRTLGAQLVVVFDSTRFIEGCEKTTGPFKAFWLKLFKQALCHTQLSINGEANLARNVNVE